jgi:thiaminase (transcriptional activator TenA)
MHRYICLDADAESYAWFVASLSNSLWQRNGVLAKAALEHPFVRGIASGELARAAFAYYVGQDAVFLDAYRRAYNLGLAKSPDPGGQIVFRELLDAVADELRLHQSYAAHWDVDLHQAADPATSAYTNFLLAVAAVEPVGHIAAAMTPCLRLYAYLGQQLADQTKPDSPYREWVMTYSSAQFEAQVQRLEALLDRYGGDSARLASLYHQAMELELQFFDAAGRRGS